MSPDTIDLARQTIRSTTEGRVYQVLRVIWLMACAPMFCGFKSHRIRHNIGINWWAEVVKLERDSFEYILAFQHMPTHSSNFRWQKEADSRSNLWQNSMPIEAIRSVMRLMQ